LKILYSFNKTGYEAEFWTKEIRAASTSQITFIPFNHDPYVDIWSYIRAQLLDNLYFDRHPGLMRLYRDVEARVRDDRVDAIIVDNCPPYHPDWLLKLPCYKVLRIADGPMSAYDRDFAYMHAYDHVLYHSPAYSRDMNIEHKLRYVGAKRADFLPLGFFDAAYDGKASEQALFDRERDIDVIFIGAQHVGKMAFLAKVKKALGRRCRLYGLTNIKRNLYFNVRYGFPGWVRTLPFQQYVPMYQRTKIGFNVHNRGKYTVGSYRLFELPANGVMQISDGEEYLDTYYAVGKEVVSYRDAGELIDKIRYYLSHDKERLDIAREGYRRVLRDYRVSRLLQVAGRMIELGMRSRKHPIDPQSQTSMFSSG